MYLNFQPNLILFFPNPLLRFAGFFVFCGILVGLYYLITWKMNPKLRSCFNKLGLVIFYLASAVFFFDMTTSLISICQINNQLGFSYATPETPGGEIFQVLWLTEGKIMEQAGLKSFDRILMNNVNDFYRLIIANQGKEIVIPIMRENKEIEIKVLIPELNVPLRRVSFLTF